MREKQFFCSFKRTMLAMSVLLLFSTLAIVPLQASTVDEISQPQERQSVSGVVSDDMGTLPGVSVVVKGTGTGAATDIDGKYTLNVETGAILVFSFVGYKTKEIAVGNQTSIDVLMSEDAQLMDEVVVVGYGTQKKVNLTGSISSVGKEELKDRVNTDVLKAVQGTVAGVTVVSRPGSSASINFRGRGNLGASSPLYVIDGAITDAEFFSSLDPGTIESISFLKDAASSAIYGSRAAYGVVLVKTKGGEKGEMKVNYNGYMGFKSATYTPEVVSSGQYAELWNEAMYNANPNNKPRYSEDEIKKFYDGSDPDQYANTNWYDLTLQDVSTVTQHQLNFSGGSDDLRYFVGMGYVHDDKMDIGAADDRFNLSGNISADIKPWLTLNTNVKYIYKQYKKETGYVPLMNALTVPVTYAAKQSNGDWGTIDGGSQASTTIMKKNPLRILEEGGWQEQHRKNSLIDLGFDIKPIKGLVLTGQFVYKGWDYRDKRYEASLDKLSSFTTGELISGSDITENKMTYDWQTSTRLLYTGLARYNWKNDIHDFGVLIGGSYEHFKLNKSKSWRKGFPNNSMGDMNGGSNADQNTYAEGGSAENKMLSYFGRINYSLFDKYLLEANLRADASSRFYETERWGVFPSFSGAWRINMEDFMSSAEWIDNLKVRASWGQLGNINNVGDYDYMPTYGMDGNYVFEGNIVNGIVQNKPANAGLSWENVAITDIGIDFDIFNGKLSLVADWYLKKTNDILLSYNVPIEVGIPSAQNPSQNLGKIENRGIEIALNHRNKIGQVSYSVGVNASKNWNEVTDLGASDPMHDGKWIRTVGQSIGTFYGYKTDGLLTQQDIDNGTYITDGTSSIQAGDIKYVDMNEDGKLDGKDRTYIGCDVPEITYGANFNVQYKNIELSVMGQGIYGAKVNFDSEQAFAFFEDSNPREWHLGRWTEANPDPNAVYPRMYLKGNANQTFNEKFSDFWLFDADYFRIKNITLGYSFPKTWMDSCFLDSAKVFFTAENPFTARADKRMKDFDPESPSGRGVGALGTRTFAFGVNVSF